MKIAVMNATKVSIAPVDQAAKEFPGLEIFHFMDEGMSWLGKAEGRISGRNLSRMISLIHSAEELGVDGILLSCTIFSPFIDQLRLCTDLPMVAADIGVFEKASQMYRKVGAIVSFEPTMKSVAWVVERCRRLMQPAISSGNCASASPANVPGNCASAPPADSSGNHNPDRSDFEVEIRLAKGAFEAAAAGDEETHNRLIYETALQFHDKEAIILSQMSQVRALPLFRDFPVPVLTSPSVSLGLLIEMINSMQTR